MRRILILAFAGTTLLFPQTPGQEWKTKEGPNHAKDRQAWFYGQRTFPSGVIPPGARRNAVLQLQRNDAAIRSQRQARRGPLSVNQAFSLTTDATNWTLLGPRPTDPGNSPKSGRVNAIAIDPRDANVIYIGAAEGGIWKSTDGGANFKPLTDDQPSLATGSITLDPNNPDIVYVGTGEENFSGDSYYGAGILKSTDGGATWSNIVGVFQRDHIGAIAVQPGNGKVLLCASYLGILRSDDGGDSWSAGVPGFGTSVFFDAANGNSAWAAIGHPAGSVSNGVYHSTDAGQTWSLVKGSGGQTLPIANVGRIELTMAPTDSNILFAQIHNYTNDGLLDIYKTIDGGATWRRLNVPAASWGSQMWFNNTIRVSPKDPNVVWSGGLGVYRSLDGGATWVPSPGPTGPNNISIHVDFHALAFTPDGSRLYLGNDGGIYSTTDVTAARVNWIDHNETLATAKFYPGMSLDPANPAVIIGGTQDNGSQRFAADGTWVDNGVCGDGGFTAIDPSFPALSYVACQQIDVQRNFGLSTGSFVPAIYGVDQTDTAPFIAPLVIDTADPRNLYFGTYRIWQTRDSAGKWSAASPDLTGGHRGTIKTIAPAPGDSNTVYVGTTNGKVQVTRDALRGGAAAWTDRSAGLPTRSVSKIAVDPLNPGVAYAGFSGFVASFGASRPGYVFKTTDFGATWTDVTGNMPAIPVNDIVIDPDLPDTLYLATDIAALVTTDGGATWTSLGKGLPNVVVHSLALQRKTRVLRAGTHGRSVWEILMPLARPSLQPTIDSVAPGKADSGGPGFVITLTGSNFVAGTVVRWNGLDRATKFMDATHITAEIPAADIALPGRASLTAFTSSTGAGSSLPKGIVIGAAPESSSAAFVSAADPSGGSALAPRGIASLYGANLASAVSLADGGPPLPFTLAATTLTVNGVAAPLFFVSAGQINFQVPLAGALGSVPLTITQGVQSTTVTVTLKAYAPSLFTTNAQGSGQASTVIAGTATLAAPVNAFPGSRPARSGEYLSIYCTGLGDVSHRPALGSASPGSPLAETLVKPTVTIGGVLAPVAFSGLAPGFVGLYQVNVQVPDGVAPGAAVPLILTIGDAPSNTATIAVDVP